MSTTVPHQRAPLADRSRREVNCRRCNRLTGTVGAMYCDRCRRDGNPALDSLVDVARRSGVVCARCPECGGEAISIGGPCSVAHAGGCSERSDGR